MSEEIPAVDLLGDPLRELPDPRGRPKHKMTTETRNEVSVLRAAGMSREDIAAVIGVSKPTLEKYYFSELNEGVVRERARALGWLRESARLGNVSAQKAYIALLDGGRAAPPTGEGEMKTEKLGKKAQAKIDAQSTPVDSSWGGLIPH